MSEDVKDRNRSKAFRPYDTYGDFYRDAYGQHIRAIRKVGSLGVTLIEAEQTPGDWSDAPVPELTMGWLPSPSVSFSCDLGAGRFSGKQRPGDAIVVAPGAGASIQMEGWHVCRALAVPFGRLREAADGLGGALPQDGDFGRLHTGLVSDASLTALLDDLWRETADESAHGALYADAAMLHIVARLARLSARSEPRRKGGLAPWQITRVDALLCADLARDHDLQSLAEAVGLSAGYFCRAFGQTTGEPPYKRLQRLRMEVAAAKLATTREPVGAIAAAVGYDDPSHFARLFRRAFGVSPAAYRRERRS